jgi:DNA-directed RNA polymerase subunit RPC12/RpoP
MTDTPQASEPEASQTQEAERQPPAGSGLKTFKCGKCAAKMEFVPGSHAQQCPYCGHENAIPASEDDIKELDFRAHLTQLSQDEQTEEHLTVKCPACAAEVTSEPNVTAQECPFCGSHIVASAGSTKHIKPKSLLPFKVTHQEGQTAFRTWLSGLWFAPNALKKMARTEGRLAGMYVPYWTYDSDTTSFYRGQRGEHYWDTEHYTTRENGRTVHKTRRVRKTRWYSVSGTVWNSFDDVLVLASNSLPRAYTEKLEPWDLEALAPYADEYLSGFRAESYQVGLEDGFGRAKEIMDVAIRQSVCRDIGGDEQRISSLKTQHANVTFKHVLLPIWISAYRYQNRVYRFLVNARTGEVQGERPWSWCKIALAVAGIVAAIAAVVLTVRAMQ